MSLGKQKLALAASEDHHQEFLRRRRLSIMCTQRVTTQEHLDPEAGDHES